MSIRFLSRPTPGRPRDRARRAVAPEVARLEGRALLTITGLTVSASPAVLQVPFTGRSIYRPKDPQSRYVSISGTVTATGNVPPLASYRLIDEQGTLNTPELPLTLTPGQPVGAGQSRFYSFALNKQRLLTYTRPGDLDGRQYTYVVTVRDAEGAAVGAATVTVPDYHVFPPIHPAFGSAATLLLFRARR